MSPGGRTATSLPFAAAIADAVSPLRTDPWRSSHPAHQRAEARRQRRADSDEMARFEQSSSDSEAEALAELADRALGSPREEEEGSAREDK